MQLPKNINKKLAELINYETARAKLTDEEISKITVNFFTDDINLKKPWHLLLPSVPERRVRLARRKIIELGYKESLSMKEVNKHRKKSLIICEPSELSEFTLDGFSLENFAIAKRSHYTHRKDRSSNNEKNI